MSDNRDLEDAEALAAEFACGLLEGADLERARRRVAADPAFAHEVARWRGRLSSMCDNVDEVTPPPGLWDRIEAARGRLHAASDNYAALRKSVARWRAAAAAMTAIAACLALVLLLQPFAKPVQAPIARPGIGQPMVALVGDEKATRVMVSWDPSARQLVYVVAGPLSGGPSKSHELWVIPVGGKPQSLGTLAAGKQSHKQLADALATLLQQGATIAISVEPKGGSPTGAPTGPVIATGELSPA